jgi:pentatricopeptide repeat protein
MMIVNDLDSLRQLFSKLVERLIAVGRVEEALALHDEMRVQKLLLAPSTLQVLCAAVVTVALYCQ